MRKIDIEEVVKRIDVFSIEARTIFDIIELADKRKASYYNNINSPDSKAIECLRDYLATLSEQELRELICLMDLGESCHMADGIKKLLMLSVGM